MSALAERLADFSRALLDPGRPIPRGLVGPDGITSAKRFNVYRNNVVSGLVSTLADAYPAVARIVGDTFFEAMARHYATREPPASPIMLAYGQGFADFIGEFEPVRSIPYLRDVARLERAWAEAYHAAEATPLEAVALESISADELMRMRIGLHPSLRLVCSKYPLLTLWEMNIDGGTPGWVDLGAGGQDVLIVRPEAEVEVRSLPRGGAAFIQALADGLCAVDAMETALTVDHRFDLAINLGGLMQARALVGFERIGNGL